MEGLLGHKEEEIVEGRVGGRWQESSPGGDKDDSSYNVEERNATTPGNGIDGTDLVQTQQWFNIWVLKI